MNFENKHLSSLIIEGILSKDLSVEEHPSIKAHLSSCKRCSDLLENSNDVSEEFFKNYPTFNALDKKFKKKRYSFLIDEVIGFIKSINYLPVSKPAIAVCISIIVISFIIIFKPTDNGKDLSIKGEPGFKLFINGNEIENDADIFCSPSDTLQFLIYSESPEYYKILYQDDGDSIKIYMPLNEGQNLPIGNLLGQSVHNSIILDSSWSRETIYCLITKERITTDSAKSIIHQFNMGTFKNLDKNVTIEKYVLKNSSK